MFQPVFWTIGVVGTCLSLTLQQQSDYLRQGYFMTFFSKKKLQPRRIEIDSSEISSESPEVQQRLDRIHSNYQQLDSILSNLEAKIESDERLSAIDQSLKDVEMVRKKKKWRPRSQSKKKSKNPKKPR